MEENSTKLQRINNRCLVILTAIALTFALVYTKDILVPFVFATFIYAILAPQLRWFQVKLKVPRIVAIGITITVFIVSISLLVLAIVNSLETFIKDADQYRQKMAQFIGWSTQTASYFGIELNANTIRSEITQLPLMTMARKFTGDVMSILGLTTLVIIFVLFLLIGDETSRTQNQFVLEIQQKVSKYISAKFFVSLSTGVIVLVVLLGFRVDLAVMFAILTFLLNFIPNIGSLMATLLPLPVVLLQFGLGWQFAVILALIGATQFFIGNILEPKMMGESMDLHPVAVLIFLMFWGLVWGIPGMFLSVPITAILKIVMSKIETTQPFAELLAGRMNVRS